MQRSHRDPHAKGVTLVELLVVITILVMLAAFAIPVIRPMTEGRRIREAARAIDVYITQAKTRAIEIQRPVGILLERITQTDTAGSTVYQDDACNVLRTVEVPPPYAGDFADSRVRVQRVVVPGWFVLNLQITPGDFSGRLLKHGDRVQLNYQGAYFEIFPGPGTVAPDFAVDVDGFITFDTTDADNDGWVDNVLSVRKPASELAAVPWPTGSWSAPTAFQFLRQPQPSPVPPLRLPRDTVIDLADSGYYDANDRYDLPPSRPRRAFETYQQASGDYMHVSDAFGRIGDLGVDADHQGPMILFAPNGAIQFVYHFQAADATLPPSYVARRVTRPVFLMVGKWERSGNEPITDPTAPVRSLAEDQLHNWQDASNIWMAIGPHNGFVTAADVSAPWENAATSYYTPGDPDETDQLNLIGQMQISRAFAREAQISKGALQQ
jgi:prepilin-type N-terminal cleavage/methylation domain-containing protein